MTELSSVDCTVGDAERRRMSTADQLSDSRAELDTQQLSSRGHAASAARPRDAPFQSFHEFVREQTECLALSLLLDKIHYTFRLSKAAKWSTIY